MVEASCRSCGALAPRAFWARDRNRNLSNARFSYHRCRACRLLFIDEVPANLSEYYPGEYYPLPGSLNDLLRQAEPERFKLELLRRCLPSGRILEIGPAQGCFV